MKFHGRVLIVNSNQEQSEGLMNLVSQAGFLDVQLAQTPDEGLQFLKEIYAQKKRVQYLFLSDTFNSVVINLITEIMNDNLLSEIKIIVIDDNGNTDLLSEAFQHGAVGRIRGPVTLEELIRTLNLLQKKVV